MGSAPSRLWLPWAGESSEAARGAEPEAGAPSGALWGNPAVVEAAGREENVWFGSCVWGTLGPADRSVSIRGGQRQRRARRWALPSGTQRGPFTLQGALRAPHSRPHSPPGRGTAVLLPAPRPLLATASPSSQSVLVGAGTAAWGCPRVM